MLEKEAKRRGVALSALTKPEYYEGILRRYAFSELNDIYGAVGYGGIASAYVISRLLEEQRKTETPALPKVQEVSHEEAQSHLGKPTHGVYVKGESGMLVRFARCCNPVPGDEIVGYITRGRGVTVHKADCINATNSEQERMVEVSWAGASDLANFKRLHQHHRLRPRKPPGRAGPVHRQHGRAHRGGVGQARRKEKDQQHHHGHTGQEPRAARPRVCPASQAQRHHRGLPWIDLIGRRPAAPMIQERKDSHMRAVIQRVEKASVSVEGEIRGQVGAGFLVLIGVEEGDGDADFKYIADKVPNLRVFEDDQGKMNRSLMDVGGEVLAVSQFTLLGDARGGRRPSFIAAARPETADPMYERLVAEWRARGIRVETGVFGAHMKVALVNDGPVTILLDSRRRF